MTTKSKIKLFIYLILQDLVNIFSDFYISNKIRYLFYKIYLKKLGKEVVINAKTHIEVPENIVIGNYCSINRNCWLSGGGGLVIGNDVLIGPNVIIHSANHNFIKSDIPYRLQGHSFKEVIIQDNVWLGAGVIILPGVTIESNSVVAAGAVVTKNVPSGVLVGGIPAKIIKELNDK
jgi:maltose O-acetyltransferase